MGAAVVTARWRSVLLGLVAVGLLGPAGAAAAAEQADGCEEAPATARCSSDPADEPSSDTEDPPHGAGEEMADESAPGIELTVTPVVGDEAEDGDLVAVDQGLVALFFSPTAPAEQRAIHEFRVRNTGSGSLHDVAVTDERIGTVLDPAAETVLAPGEVVVVRSAMTFTFEEAATVLGGLFTSTATATGTDDAGTTVADTADARLELVAVLASPTVDLLFEVVPSAGDVGGADPPTVQWTRDQAAADEPRMVRYRVTVTNTSSVDLEQVELVVDVLPTPLVTAADGIVLAPGDELIREFDRQVHVGDLGDLDDVGEGGAGVDLVATATFTAVAGARGQTAIGRDDAVLRATVLPAGDAEVLPAAGGDPTTGFWLTLLLLAAGTAMVRAGRSSAVSGRAS